MVAVVVVIIIRTVIVVSGGGAVAVKGGDGGDRVVVFTSVELGVRRGVTHGWESVVVQRRTVYTRRSAVMIHLTVG